MTQKFLQEEKGRRRRGGGECYKWYIIKCFIINTLFYFYFYRYIIKLITVDGSLSEKSSRHMLQASSQACCIPPSTKAAADVKWLSGFVSSISGTF